MRNIAISILAWLAIICAGFLVFKFLYELVGGFLALLAAILVWYFGGLIFFGVKRRKTQERIAAALESLKKP